MNLEVASWCKGFKKIKNLRMSSNNYFLSCNMYHCEAVEQDKQSNLFKIRNYDP